MTRLPGSQPALQRPVAGGCGAAFRTRGVGRPSLRCPIAVAAALTFGTGAIDVTTLTHLHGVFASVITGNLMFTGLGIAHGDAALVAHTAAAIGGFLIGVSAGTRLAGMRDPGAERWP